MILKNSSQIRRAALPHLNLTPCLGIPSLPSRPSVESLHPLFLPRFPMSSRGHVTALSVHALFTLFHACSRYFTLFLWGGEGGNAPVSISSQVAMSLCRYVATSRTFALLQCTSHRLFPGGPATLPLFASANVSNAASSPWRTWEVKPSTFNPCVLLRQNTEKHTKSQ